jgi:hypothetical protein
MNLINLLNLILKKLRAFFTQKGNSSGNKQKANSMVFRQNVKIQSLWQKSADCPCNLENSDIDTFKKKFIKKTKVIASKKKISETDGLNQISSNQFLDLSLYQQKTLDLISHTKINHHENNRVFEKGVLETIITRIAIAQAQMEHFLRKGSGFDIASYESLLKTQLKIETLFTNLRIQGK